MSRSTIDIKAISEQLGHKDVKTTYDTYVHLLKDTKVKEIDKLERIDDDDDDDDDDE